MNFLSNDLTIVHVIPAGLSIMVLLFHFLITIRKHDMIALNCAFFTGKLPLWYVKKNNPIWYEHIMSERKITLERLSNSGAQINKNLIERSDLTNAVLKFTLLTNSSPNIEEVKAFVDKLQANIQPDKLKRIIELAEELKEETKEENKQKVEDGSQQNEKGQTDV
jgi:predicted oxidoreductase